jgi:drug/metabolite transporter (DMT)-like permease
MKGLKWVIFSILFISIGSLTLKYGVTQIGELTLNNLSSMAVAIVTNPYILMGLFVYLCSSFTWMLAISKSDLSQAYPILSSTYAFIPIFSWILFHDVISIQRWVGIGVVCIGIILMSRS